MAQKEATVGEIADILKHAKDHGTSLCLLIGAGVSRSAGIGMAGDFVQRISKAYPSHYQKVCNTCESGRTPSYAQCMDALPPANQVALIRDDIEQSKINWAHIGIARLERAGILDTILTPNFDPLASRACALFHRFPAIYDLAGLRDGGANQINFDKSYVKGSAIFHLHGQHTGFLLLNTDEKLQAQAERIEPVLDAVMKGKPVIIAGYSGENDPLIDKIVALAPFNHGLFWVCHDGNDPAPNVRNKLLSLDNCQIVRNMPGDKFFTDLANALNLDAPEFLVGPFDHMTSVLETIRPYSDLGDKAGSDLLDAAKKMLSAAIERQRKDQPNFTEIAELMAKGQYEDVWAKFGGLNANISKEDHNSVAWAATMIGIALFDEAKAKGGEEATELFGKAGEKYAAALAIKPDMHEALYNWGNALANNADTKTGDAAAQLLHEARKKFAAALEIKPDMHQALYNWGNTLVTEAQEKFGEEAIALLHEAGRKFASALEIKSDKNEALYNWGCALDLEAQMHTGKEAAKRFRKAGEKFAAVLKIKPDDYEALNGWGSVLIAEASLAKGNMRTNLLAEAKKKLLETESIKPGRALYNLACISALQGDAAAAADFLRQGFEMKSGLPSCAHIIKDTDFDQIRDTEAFRKVLQDIGCI